VSSYLREEGASVEDLERWKAACQEAHNRSSIAAKEYRANLPAVRAKIASVQLRLTRKEKALAEGETLQPFARLAREHVSPSRLP